MEFDVFVDRILLFLEGLVMVGFWLLILLLLCNLLMVFLKLDSLDLICFRLEILVFICFFFVFKCFFLGWCFVVRSCCIRLLSVRFEFIFRDWIVIFYFVKFDCW